MLFRIKRRLSLPVRRLAHARRAVRWRIDRARRFAARCVAGAIHVAKIAGWTIFGGATATLAVLAYMSFAGQQDGNRPQDETPRSLAENTGPDTVAWVPNRNRNDVIEQMMCGPKPPPKPVLASRPIPLVWRPSPSPAPEPSFRCADGSASFAVNWRGACSMHGGIAQEFKPARSRPVFPPVAEKTPAPIPTIAAEHPSAFACADGTVSFTPLRRRACAGHGGIATRSVEPAPPAPAPAPDASRTLAFACADGTLSLSAPRRIACAAHGGIATRKAESVASTPRPEPAPDATKAPSFTCADGTPSLSARRGGACSSHGGIAPAPDSPTPFTRTHRERRTCSDGSTSTAGPGACSNHGGLRK